VRGDVHAVEFIHTPYGEVKGRSAVFGDGFCGQDYEVVVRWCVRCMYKSKLVVARIARGKMSVAHFPEAGRMVQIRVSDLIGVAR